MLRFLNTENEEDSENLISKKTVNRVCNFDKLQAMLFFIIVILLVQLILFSVFLYHVSSLSGILSEAKGDLMSTIDNANILVKSIIGSVKKEYLHLEPCINNFCQQP